MMAEGKCSVWHRFWVTVSGMVFWNWFSNSDSTEERRRRRGCTDIIDANGIRTLEHVAVFGCIIRQKTEAGAVGKWLAYVVLRLFLYITTCSFRTIIKITENGFFGYLLELDISLIVHSCTEPNCNKCKPPYDKIVSHYQIMFPK